MSSAERIRGEPVAAGIRKDVSERIADFRARGIVPSLGTVLMSNSESDQRFMELKHTACDEMGIRSRDLQLDPDASERELHRAVDRLCSDPDIHGVFVQVPLPEHVDVRALRERIAPEKDVDCFHPENLGRLVAGDPRFVPATTAAVCRLLESASVSLDGQHVVIVGRSPAIGLPLANWLIHTDATVTVCHSRTTDLSAVTRRADVLVTACGVPELIDGSMLSAGVVCVDVSANRQESGGVVGDVEYESALSVAEAITPVPGGVGPVTLASLLQNVVDAVERQT